ncbi:MAG: type II toxin-antitoxin system RelB/DinJ family antitoxin [Spirochaetia bacterium]|jgi:DNA-damage-inducible protein J|nr:type II toxin-antitoxin system RelB/DinJ family antitoxin [Spirochaetia bacterium]
MTQNVNIRMEPELKKQAEELFSELGMNMSTAFTIFVRQAVRQRKIPFEISAPKPVIRAGYPVPPGEEDDPFYSKKNLRHLQKAVKEVEAGKVVKKNMEELLEMEK